MLQQAGETLNCEPQAVLCIVLLETKYIEQSPWEAAKSSANQKFPALDCIFSNLISTLFTVSEG